MLIKESKLRQIIEKIINEVTIDFKTGQPISDGMGMGGGASGGGGGGGTPDSFEDFEYELILAVKEMGMPVQKISVIDPEDLDVYDDIEDDIYDELKGFEPESEYSTFGQGMREDEIEDLFVAEGPDALDEFFEFAIEDFEYFESGSLYKTDDSISFIYEGRTGQEYQVSIMFF